MHQVSECTSHACVRERGSVLDHFVREPAQDFWASVYPRSFFTRFKFPRNIFCKSAQVLSESAQLFVNQTVWMRFVSCLGVPKRPRGPVFFRKVRFVPLTYCGAVVSHGSTHKTHVPATTATRFAQALDPMTTYPVPPSAARRLLHGLQKDFFCVFLRQKRLRRGSRAAAWCRGGVDAARSGGAAGTRGSFFLYPDFPRKYKILHSFVHPRVRAPRPAPHFLLTTNRPLGSQPCPSDTLKTKFFYTYYTCALHRGARRAFCITVRKCMTCLFSTLRDVRPCVRHQRLQLRLRLHR